MLVAPSKRDRIAELQVALDLVMQENRELKTRLVELETPSLRHVLILWSI